MAEKPQIPSEPPADLPAGGGSYIRDAKGRLIPAPEPTPAKED